MTFEYCSVTNTHKTLYHTYPIHVRMWSTCEMQAVKSKYKWRSRSLQSTSMSSVSTAPLNKTIVQLINICMGFVHIQSAVLRTRVRSRLSHVCTKRSYTLYCVPFASAVGAGAGAGAGGQQQRRDDVTHQSTDDSSVGRRDANYEQNNLQKLTFDQLEQNESVYTQQLDNAAALQVDDGSLAAEVSFLPRKLVKKTRVKKLSLDTARFRFLTGFDEGIVGTVALLALFAVWYWSNTVFNVYNKQVLKVFPYPLTCTVAQFGVATVLMASLWAVRIKRAPVFNRFLFTATAPLAACHAAGFLLTNMSLGKVSVAFTHTVKATEPFFSVALTPSILGDIPTWGILGSLFPIVAGVALASATEVSFNWIGFLCAIGSNIALQSRNVLSKKLMKQQSIKSTEGIVNGGGIHIQTSQRHAEEEERAMVSLDNINLFSTMTILALMLLAPICYFWEGLPLFSAAATQSVTHMSTMRLYTMLGIGGICRCMDVLSSYMILKRVSPVTHSVGNCVKRAVVIGVSIVFFKTQMTLLNIIGTVLALSGVLLYSVIVAACKQNSFGQESPVCKPIYEPELELTEGGGI